MWRGSSRRNLPSKNKSRILHPATRKQWPEKLPMTLQMLCAIRRDDARNPEDTFCAEARPRSHTCPEGSSRHTHGRVEAARDPEYTPYDPSDAAAAEIQIDAHRICMDSATGGIDDLVFKKSARVPEEAPCETGGAARIDVRARGEVLATGGSK